MNTAFFSLLVVAILGYAFHTWVNMPVVYVSGDIKECVYVNSPYKEHNCDNLPEKYELVVEK